MVKNNTSVEYNIDKHSYCEGYKNGDIGDNQSKGQYSDPDTSDIEVSPVGSSEVSSDHMDFGDELDDNALNMVNNATVTANANIPYWTLFDLTSLT